ncbi:MAG: FAD binding domain-containing protein [Anaerolineales bacterium]|nr:FAD binding domain-containing protein [Anaerolineales bacterium]
MNLWQEYIRPATLSQALKAFAESRGPALPIAGGTDLMLDLAQGRHAPVHTLVDVTSIAEMIVLELREDELFVGASVPVNRIVSDRLAGTHAQALTEACELIAGPQVRNVATLGGNVAHALPAADGTIALLALNAEAEIAGINAQAAVPTNAPAAVPGGDSLAIRRIPFNELFIGPGISSLKHGEELLVGFYIPIQKTLKVSQTFRVSSCFKRIMRPQGVALPIINLAIWLERADDTVKQIRIAVGPGAPTPWRATEAEKFMAGKPMNDETVNAALEAVLAQIGFRSSPRRASANYRRHLVEGLFRDTLEAAWERSW